MSIDDLVVWYFVLREKPRPPQPRKPLGSLAWFTLGLLALTLAMIVVRLVWRWPAGARG